MAYKAMCRSREGAWIEILSAILETSVDESRSREGAWIEIEKGSMVSTSRRSRSREGAWIEIQILKLTAAPLGVAPVRERGLK